MKIAYGALIATLILLVAWGYYDLNKKINTSPTAVIDLESLYLSFDMTKELERKYLNLSKERNLTIDSLGRAIKLLQQQSDIEAQQAVQKMQVTAYQHNTLKQQNETMKLELEQQIWTQLNQYLQEFGTQQNYPVVLGAKGDGNIIYAASTIDITEQAIEFINQKYRGIK